MDISTITNILDNIPVIITFIRNTITSFVPVDYYIIIIAALSIIAAYYFMKQFITSGWSKLSTLLNLLLIALLLFTIFVYVR